MLVVVRGMFAPSFFGVAVLISVLPLAPCASAFVSVLVAPLALLICLGYSFGWPGCAFVCWFRLSSLSSLSLSRPRVALPLDFLGPLESNIVTYPTHRNASYERDP